MEEKSVAFDSNQAEDSNNHGWQKVTYAKKQRKNQAKPSPADSAADKIFPNGSIAGVDSVFKTIEKQSEERRRRIEAQRASAVYPEDDVPTRSAVKHRSDDDDYDSDLDGGNGARGAQNGTVDEKKKEKAKKPKKPKVSVAEAAAKIDSADLAAFLSEVSVSYETQQDIQMMRFADYFGRAFSAVTASQFPWLKLFRESAVAKMADVPISHISEEVYKTSTDWINQRSYEALGSFLLWSLDSILADVANQQAGVKKGLQHTSSKSQVAIFVVLAMVLRRKPDVLINLLPTMKDNSKYQGLDKLPVIIWMIVQASQGDLAVGLYLWAHQILPVVGGKLGSNPQCRDLVLQLVERILSAPKARTILVNNAVRKGERLIPPSALDLLVHLTFPATSARVKATERFEAIYPTLKEVALAGAPGSKAMKQTSQQILALAIKSAGEGIPDLSQESINISIWCLAQNPDSYKQWEKIYADNIEVSVAILRKLCEEWKQFSTKHSSVDALGKALKSIRQENEKGLNARGDIARQSMFKEADKYCKVLAGKLSRSRGCLKSLAMVVVIAAIGAVVMSPRLDGWDWDKFSVLLNTQPSF